MPKEKQGPAFYLSLTGKAREAALEVPIDDMKEEDGLESILVKLDKLFEQDLNQSAYLAYEQFGNFKRPLNMPMKEYLIQFEKLYTNIKKHNMVLPDGVMAYRVLNSANLDSEQKQLCRATLSDLKYDLMVAQLKKIFGDCVSPSWGSVEEEPVFQTEACDSERDTYYAHRGRGHQNRGRGRGNKQVKFRGSSRNAGYGDRRTEASRSLNPEDPYGNMLRCINRITRVFI